MRTDHGIQVISQNQADARNARVHAAFPCVMAKGSWLMHTPFLGGYTGSKPQPRRQVLTP